MIREYDIFEVLPSGSVLLRAVARGLEAAEFKLQEFAKHTANECFAMYTPTRQVVALANAPHVRARTGKRVFQIAYNEELGLRRAELLRQEGYWVVSVIGNEPAVVLLNSIQRYDLFIVGDGALEHTRREMIDWLKAKYPNVKILALNPPQQELPTADFNVTLNGTEEWLSIVAQQ